MKSYKKSFCFLLLILSAFSSLAKPKEEKHELLLNLDGTLFFRDNEFDTPMMKGYSLPGFRMQTDLEYRPSKWISLRGGVWLMHYWGTNNYPNTSYIGIPNYSTDNNSHGLHALPYLSLEMRTQSGLAIILGDIHQRNGHGLLQQIYSPELRLTSDPEAGVQILYTNRWIDIDAWLDWKTFIYNNSPYQENFFVGFSSNLKYTSPKSSVHLYSPIQTLIEHRGGEIDTITHQGVQTFVNAAAGLGAKIKTGHKGVRAVTIEADLLYSWEQAGKVWHDKNGCGVYAFGKIEMKHCDFTAGYFKSWKYNTVLGYPFWGVDSHSTPGLTVHNPSTIYAGFNYTKEWTRGFSLNAKVDLYQQLSMNATNYNTGESMHYGAKTNFAFEVTMRFSPSFLLKKIPTTRSRQ